MTELFFKKLQADFDSLVEKQSQTKHAKKTFGVDLTKVANNVNSFFAPKVNAYALA